jgi:hypothetical protein
VLKAKFAEIDTDGSGELDASELATLFESLGKAVSVRLGASPPTLDRLLESAAIDIYIAYVYNIYISRCERLTGTPASTCSS